MSDPINKIVTFFTSHQCGTNKNDGNCLCKTSSYTISLWTASEIGDYDTLKNKLERNPSQAKRNDPYGYTPLHYAAINNHIKIIKLLLGCGVDINDHKSGVTPLYIAVANNNMDAVKILIDNNCDLNIPSSITKLTPIMKAYEEKYLELFIYLKEKGANIDENLYINCLKELEDNINKLKLEEEENEKIELENKLNEDTTTSSIISSAISTSYCFLTNTTTNLINSFKSQNQNTFNQFEENEKNFISKLSSSSSTTTTSSASVVASNNNTQCFNCQENIQSGTRTKTGKLLCDICKKKDPLLIFT